MILLAEWFETLSYSLGLARTRQARQLVNHGDIFSRMVNVLILFLNLVEQFRS